MLKIKVQNINANYSTAFYPLRNYCCAAESDIPYSTLVISCADDVGFLGPPIVEQRYLVLINSRIATKRSAPAHTLHEYTRQ